MWLTTKRSVITIYNDVYDEHLFVFAARPFVLFCAPAVSSAGDDHLAARGRTYSTPF
jgi:hypothetical protein